MISPNSLKTVKSPWLSAAKPPPLEINMRTIFKALAFAGLAIPGLASAAGVITMHKDPNCGCCSAWADRMRDAGFEVITRPNHDMQGVKRAHGVPGQLASCHTSTVDGYVIEGHVPAVDVQRLLQQRPAVAGIAVPGMPLGSPGMEAGGQTQPFQVVGFAADGRVGVFAQH